MTNAIIMRKLGVVLSVLFYTVLFGQTYLETKINKDSAIADFKVFKEALMSGHPGIYWYKNKDEISNSFDNAEKQLNKDISNREFHKILTSVMNDISCGHSTVLYSAEYSKLIDTLALYLPFQFKEINNKLFITEAINNSDIILGSQVVSINNKNIDEILSVIKSKIPSDKGIGSKKIRSLDLLFSYYYTQYVENASEFEIVLLQPDEKTNKITVNAVLWDGNYMYHSLREYSSSRMPINYSIYDEIAEIEIATFGSRNFKKENINFVDTIARIFKDIDNKKIENLIIDLRGNNGGSLMFGELLLSYLTNNDIKFYKRNVMNEDIAEGNFKYADLPRFLDMFEEEYGILKKEGNQYIIPTDSTKTNKPYFNGNVFFITDGLTFSATSNFISVCKANNIGTIVGETPGGASIGCNGGGPITIDLPHSDFRLFYYIIGFRLNVNENSSEIKPDFPIQDNINNILNGVDTPKDYVQELIDKNNK